MNNKKSAGRKRRGLIWRDEFTSRIADCDCGRALREVTGRAGEGRRPVVPGAASPVVSYLRCLLTSLVISNMLTVALPPNTAFNASSALIMRLFFLSCRPFFLMYAQSFLVTSVRGIAFDPTTSASLSLG